MGVGRGTEKNVMDVYGEVGRGTKNGSGISSWGSVGGLKTKNKEAIEECEVGTKNVMDNPICLCVEGGLKIRSRRVTGEQRVGLGLENAVRQFMGVRRASE